MQSDIEEFRAKYAQRLEAELGTTRSASGGDGPMRINSQDYENFKRQYLPTHLSWYERACNFSEKVFKVAPDKKTVPKLQEAIQTCHLHITPTGVMSFSLLAPALIILISIVLGFMLPFALTGGEFVEFFFVLSGLIGALAIIVPLQKAPFSFARQWRMRASNQMVLCTFYIVTYMRHTSNLELAIDFAAEHLGPPLSIDLKKIIWNIETGKFDSIRESLDDYLVSWRETNMEFIESMHLIESSLFESSEERRITTLDKSLTVMLDETYEKMLHYAHGLKGPITTLHMMGIILPILTLVILPLAVSFMDGIQWYHLLMFYNVGLPLGVYYLAQNILSNRPSGYGETDISEDNPEFRKFRSVIIKMGKDELRLNPATFAVLVAGFFFFVAISPLLLWQMGGDCADIVIGNGIFLERKCDVAEPGNIQYSLLDYRKDMKNIENDKMLGPYGLGATTLSFGIPLALGVGAGLWYRLRSKNVIKIRTRAKKLENEFASALFQLGNRLGDGYPAEIAFQKVAYAMQGTISGKFFELVSMNIQKSGMGVERAIFDPHNGALLQYPSHLIESSMKVLVESSRKGPLIASQALINVAEYIKQMHRVDERLRDLMSDVISSMTSQIKFLTPAIAGIVIGITSMITQILGKLGSKLGEFGGEDGGAMGAGGALFQMFGNGVPTYYFQIIVGLYVVQIVFIMTLMINGIQNGADKLNERYLLGNNLIKSTITYCMIALVVMLLFSLVAGQLVNVDV